MYTCAGSTCNYLFVHDARGWFYVYDHDSHKEPLRWGIGGRFDWADRDIASADCFRKPLIPVEP